MYKLRLDPEQVKGVGPNVYDVIAMYEDRKRCNGCGVSDNTITAIVRSNVANTVRLDLDSGIATVIGLMKKKFFNPIAKAAPGDVVEFPCGCVVKVLDVDFLADLFDDDNEPWDVQYASVHVIDER